MHHDDEQKRIAEQTIAELGAARIWDQRIVTEVVPLDVFYPAEEYHQQYFERNPQTSRTARSSWRRRWRRPARSSWRS